MARQRGKETPQRKSRGAPDPEDVPSPTGPRESRARSAPRDEGGGGVPDLVRRALTVGFSGLFTTEEAVRKALGDTLPRDWIDFAVDQSGRAREEFMERISVELGRSLGEIDLAAVLGQLLEGRTLEVTASIKLGPVEEDGTSKVDVEVASEKKR